MPPQAPQLRVSRQLSERAVFEGLLHDGPISRAELSKSTGLSKQTISEVVDAFEQRGWAQSVGRTSGAIGRTAVLYELRPESGFVVGVDLGETKLTAAIADMSCAIRFELTEPTDPRGGIAVLDQISRLAARLARKVDSDLAGVLCTAIGSRFNLGTTALTLNRETRTPIPHTRRSDARSRNGNILKVNWLNCFRSWLEGSGQVMVTAHPIIPPIELTGQYWEARQGSL